jgi:hypothetical protein
MRTLTLALLSGALLVGCAAMQQGPPVELTEVAVPKVAEETSAVARPPAAAALSPPALPEPRQSFQAWIPRRIMPNGDVHDGHYVTVSDKAPQKELTKPDYEIPKAPKQLVRPQAKQTPSGGQPTAPVPTPPAPPALPPSQGPLPPGFSLPQEGAYGHP